MATIKYKPTTPARRNMSVPDFAEITKFTPEKSLIEIKKKNAGRNSYGKITVRHRGGGNKQKYRKIDFIREFHEGSEKVIGVEYDPNRTAYIALVQNEEGAKKYVIAPVGLTDNDTIYSGPNADIKPGNTLPISNIPVGTFIYNIELYPGKGAQLVRSAGSAAQLMAKENGMAQVRLPSGEVRIGMTNGISLNLQSHDVDEFFDAYPGSKLFSFSMPDITNLKLNSFDIGITYNIPESDELVLIYS